MEMLARMFVHAKHESVSSLIRRAVRKLLKEESNDEQAENKVSVGGD